MRVVKDVQAALLANGIHAEMWEIVHAIMSALASRPSLCQGLVAAYLVEG
ncbi:MAG TPA: hypothetical protein VGS41_03080 [Chthonomonadales bacterium]|nr:hypothetical protein [Chthonomonadales bacterium]